jgi:hypothetical protein
VQTDASTLGARAEDECGPDRRAYSLLAGVEAVARKRPEAQ